MDDNQKWHNAGLLERASKALEKNNFKALVFNTRQEAVAGILDLINKGDSAGFGGSMTLEGLGIAEKLRERKNTVFQHTAGMPFEQALEIRKQALTADVYLASPNAVTLNGRLLFLDGVGNRAAGMIFGPKKVIAVAGINKIAQDEASGWQRIENTASPTNVKRLNLQTPCAKDGICHDCDSPQRICNVAVTLRKKPRLTEYYVVLIGEELGY